MAITYEVATTFDPQLVTPAGLFQPSRTWRGAS